jgi:hypothetical protein
VNDDEVVPGAEELELGSAPRADDASLTKEPAKPSRMAWAALGVLALLAIAIPLTHHHVLVEDDFTTPKVLRAWPETAGLFAYVDGEYLVTTVSSDASQVAYRSLPSPVSGMTIAVDVRAVLGDPIVDIECVSGIRETPSSADPSVTVKTPTDSYLFLFHPSDGGYVMASSRGGGNILSEGTAVGSGRLTIGCVAGSDGTKLSLQVGSGPTREFTDPNGFDTFRAIGLGVAKLKTSTTAEVAFDNLRALKAN